MVTPAGDGEVGGGGLLCHLVSIADTKLKLFHRSIARQMSIASLSSVRDGLVG